VTLFGDLPFMVALDSADVWARQHDFRLDASLGVPPDAFSETGQDWKLPVYKWDVIAEGGFAWLRQRARRNAELFGGYRVDHLVGFYRTFWRTRGDSAGQGWFTPPDEPSQTALGEQVLRVFLDSGAEIVAEDLGVVPDFVRASLEEQGVPGCKVLRWERDWHSPEAPFIPPDDYPTLSAALTGTHDTEPMVVWWNNAPRADRQAILQLPLFRDRGVGDPDAPWTDALRDTFIELIYRSGSDAIFFPMQDLFGWSDRVNVPATVGPHNWTWTLPWRVDRIADTGECAERAGFLRRLAASAGRVPPSDYTSGHAPDGAQTE
jgi:4-alpha-glucanotransferase